MVDQSALQIARKIAPLASTPDELVLAQDALRLADHEVDLAFANALREAAEAPQEPSPETRELHQRMEDAEAKVKSAQDRLATLTKQVEAAKGDEKDAVNAQMMLAKAEAELDQDEFNDAKEDLIRAGGNPEGTLQRLLDEHEAADHAGENTTAQLPQLPQRKRRQFPRTCPNLAHSAHASRPALRSRSQVSVHHRHPEPGT